ncbi:MAG: helix-turn-helix domain-containing protein [Bacteroidota bacterium]
MAAKISIPPRELSRSINRIHGQSFFDYINRHRIQLAQEKIRQATDPKITVLEIMYEVGFQSKSSFNTAFKKFAGMTPTQWKAQVKK